MLNFITRPGICGFSINILWQDNEPIFYDKTITFEASIQIGFRRLEYMQTIDKNKLAKVKYLKFLNKKP